MELPPVSALIPCLNEEVFITACIKSILLGSYPVDRLEILVIDGGSKDKTLDLVKQLKQKFPQIRILNNPKKTVPAALNIGLEEAQHEHLVWLGAHATYDEHYIKNSVETLLNNNVSSVGGVITPVGRSFIGRAIALATKSKLAIGNAKYRYATSTQQVDTVFGGCWLKSNIINAGRFDESWTRNQDYELNTRLRERIGPILLNPEIKCRYFCRDSLRDLAHQYFEYGFWRFRTLSKHPSSINVRVIAPPTLVITTFISLAITPLIGISALTPIAFYAFVCSINSLLLTIENKNFLALPILPFIFPCIHYSWGMGFLYSFISHKKSN